LPPVTVTSFWPACGPLLGVSAEMLPAALNVYTVADAAPRLVVVTTTLTAPAEAAPATVTVTLLAVAEPGTTVAAVPPNVTAVTSGPMLVPLRRARRVSSHRAGGGAPQRHEVAARQRPGGRRGRRQRARCTAADARVSGPARRAAGAHGRCTCSSRTWCCRSWC
jgi:hypothetical protein